MLNNVNIKVFPFQGGNRSAAPAALKGENQFGNIKKFMFFFFQMRPSALISHPITWQTFRNPHPLLSS